MGLIANERGTYSLILLLFCPISLQKYGFKFEALIRSHLSVNAQYHLEIFSEIHLIETHTNFKFRKMYTFHDRKVKLVMAEIGKNKVINDQRIKQCFLFLRQVRWSPVDNTTRDFSNYVISYLQTDTDTEWNQVEVEISATEKTIVELQPDSQYLFCISVASGERGSGIRSPTTAVHTDVGKVCQFNSCSMWSFGMHCSCQVVASTWAPTPELSPFLAPVPEMNPFLAPIPEMSPCTPCCHYYHYHYYIHFFFLFFFAFR